MGTILVSTHCKACERTVEDEGSIPSVSTERKNDMDEVTNLTETCQKCGGIETFLVETEDLHAWKEGAYIQDVLGYLTADQRELLISGICGPCFDGMFE